MKKRYLNFAVIFCLLFSIMSCSGITDVYSKKNYNVILTVPGGNSSRSMEDYTVDDVRTRISECLVNVYPCVIDEATGDEQRLDSPIYSQKKSAGSVIKLRVEPDVTYVVGITPFWVVDGKSLNIYEEEFSESFTVNSESNTPCAVTVTFQKDDFYDFDNLLFENAYQLTGVGSFGQPVQTYDDLLTAISKAKNGNIPTKIFVGCDSYTMKSTFIDCQNTINISDKNIIFAPGNPNYSTYFSCSSNQPVFSIGKNGRLTTKHEMKITCSENTAFEVTSNGYLNFTGDILSASSDHPVILATDNAEVRIHGEDFGSSEITVANDTNASVDSLMNSQSSFITASKNAKLLLSEKASLGRVSVFATEKASVNIKNSEIVALQAPAVSVGNETTLRMNEVVFTSCIASEGNEQLSDNYNGIVMIDNVTEGDWNDSKVKPGYFEFSNITCNGCIGDFIVSGADIVLGGENLFDSIFMTYKYDPTNNMNSRLPRIFIKEDFAPNPDKTDPIKLSLQQNTFIYLGDYMPLVNGDNSSDHVRYNVTTGLAEKCYIYPEFFLTTERKNISTLNKEYNLTDCFELSGVGTSNVSNFKLNNEGIICWKFFSAVGNGFNTKNNLENIIIENTAATQIVETSNVIHANHFWGSTRGQSEITNSDSGFFPFFRMESSEPVVFDGSTGKIKFSATGSDSQVGQAVFINTPDDQNMDLTLRNVEFNLKDCNPIIMSKSNSTVTLDDCLFNVTSVKSNPTGVDTGHIVVYGDNCTVKLTGTYTKMLIIYIAGKDFKLTAGPDLTMTEDVYISFVFADDIKEFYPNLSDVYNLRTAGGGKIIPQANLP